MIKLKAKMENGQLQLFKDGEQLNPMVLSMNKQKNEDTLNFNLESAQRISVGIPAVAWEVEITVPEEIEDALNHVCQLL